MGNEQSLEGNLKLIDAALADHPLTLEELAAKTGKQIEEVTSIILMPDGQSRYPDKYGRARLGFGGEIVYFVAKPIGTVEEVLPQMPSPAELAREALVDRLKEYGAPAYVVELARQGRQRSITNYVAEEQALLVTKKSLLDRVNAALLAAGELNGKSQVRRQM